MTTATTPLTLTARTPEDILAAVPVVLGFQPQDSLVVMTFGGTSPFHARVDLPPPDDAPAVLSMLLAPARRQRVRGAVIVAYTDDHRTARCVARHVANGFRREGIEILDLLRAHEGRWFTLNGRSGVPPHGVPYDEVHHPFLAQAVFSGQVIHGSRAELVALLDPVADRVARVAARVGGAVPCDAEEVALLVATHLADGSFPDEDLARLLPALGDPPVRDAAWTGMTRESSSRHVRLWTDAVQRAPAELVPGVAAVLAFAAWLSGNGALAWCAIDRCRAVEPRHSLADVVAGLLTRAVSPDTWEEVVRVVADG